MCAQETQAPKIEAPKITSKEGDIQQSIANEMADFLNETKTTYTAADEITLTKSTPKINSETELPQELTYVPEPLSSPPPQAEAQDSEPSNNVQLNANFRNEMMDFLTDMKKKMREDE